MENNKHKTNKYQMTSEPSLQKGCVTVVQVTAREMTSHWSFSGVAQQAAGTGRHTAPVIGKDEG